jgi:Holliday junction resolvasome RuvABC endonuclease subunit
MVDISQLCKLVSIDPGTDTIGIATIWFDPYTMEIACVNAHTLHTSRQCHETWKTQIHSNRFDRINAIREYLLEQFNVIEPNIVACESPYISLRTPSAFAALTEAVLMIRLAVADYSSWMGLEMIDPSSVKKAVGVKGKADSDKDKVKNAIRLIPEIMLAMSSNIDTLDEHSIDAIAVGYYLLTYLRGKHP